MKFSRYVVFNPYLGQGGFVLLDILICGQQYIESSLPDLGDRPLLTGGDPCNQSRQ